MTTTANVAALGSVPASVKGALLASAVKSITISLDSGAQAEASIVDTVKALTFLALDKIGAEMIQDGFDIKTSKAFSDPYTMVLKRLINAGKRVYRDSEDSFAEHVKGKKGDDRLKGITAYMKASKGKDLVWTVAQIRAIGNKVVKAATESEEHKEFARKLSQTEDFATAEGDFNTWFRLNFGVTYKQVTGAFTKEGGEARNVEKSITGQIAKLDDVEMMDRLIAALEARREVVKANGQKLDALIGPAEDEGLYDNVVPMAA
jgi:hypothetical protein